MVFAVMGAMSFANAARRDNAHNFITTRLSTENMAVPPVTTDATWRGDPAVFCEFRFTTSAARDQFFTDLLTQLQGVNGPVVGSWAAKHDCPSGADPTVDCVESVRQVW